MARDFPVLFPELDNMPPVLHEENLKCFRFLFEGELHNGLQFKDDIFCRCHSVEAENRLQLYQDAHQLFRQEKIVITANKATYSIWLSLRSPRAALYLTQKTLMPSPDETAPPAIIELVAEQTATGRSTPPVAQS